MITFFIKLLTLSLFCLALQTPSLSWAGRGSGHFVGNGGEVLRISGQFYLRDLYEGGVHLNPFVGDSIDETIRRRIQNSAQVQSLNELGVDPVLLAKKLTDLNTLSPNLGHYVLSAIEYYQWNIVASSLGKLQDTAPVLDIPEADRFVAANRLMNSIRLANSPDLPLWDLLSAEGRVALVLHEALYSLTQVECENRDRSRCAQNPLFSREAVAAVFSENQVKKASISLLLLRQFVLPVRGAMCKNEFSAVADTAYTNAAGLHKIRVLARLENPFSASERLRFVDLVCEDAERFQAGPNANIFIGLNRLSYRVQPLFYSSFKGMGGRQIQLNLLDQTPQVHKQIYPLVSKSACRLMLTEMLRSWFDVEDAAMGDRKSICQMN